MFNLAALGAGFGQGMQQIQQQQESQLRQLQARMALDQLQRGLRERALAGQALAAGGLPGFGGGIPNTPMQPIGGGQPPAMGMPQPAGPQVPQQSPLPPLSSNAGTPRGVIPLDDDQEGADYAAQRAKDMGVPILSYDVENEAAKAPAEPPAGGASGTDAAMGAGATPAAASSPDSGVTLDDMPAYLQMFRHVDPVQIAQRIKQIRPEADDGAVLGATEILTKMAQGGLREQQTAASMMKFLIGDKTRRDLAAQSGALRERGQDLSHQDRVSGQQVTREGQQTRAATAAATQDRIDKRLEARISEQRYQRAQAAATGQQKLRLSELHRQLNDIRGRISAIDNGPNATSAANKQARDALLKRYDDIAERERKNAEAVLGADGEE